MDKTIITDANTFRAEMFRLPSPRERRLGLWVDRVGWAMERNPPGKFRLLGLYGAVLARDGSGTFQTRRAGELRARPGDIMLLFPEEPSRYYPDSEWKLSWILWGGPEADALFALGGLSPERPIIRGAADRFAAAFKGLGDKLEGETPTDVLTRKIILLTLARDLGEAAEAPRSSAKNADRLEKAFAWVRDREKQPVSAADMARAARVSAPRFRRLFKDATGQTPKEYAIAFKMAKAKALLSKGLSLKETAAALGYDDLFYFSRLFRKTTGVSPGKYRDRKGV